LEKRKNSHAKNKRRGGVRAVSIRILLTETPRGRKGSVPAHLTRTGGCHKKKHLDKKRRGKDIDA